MGSIIFRRGYRIFPWGGATNQCLVKMRAKPPPLACSKIICVFVNSQAKRGKFSGPPGPPLKKNSMRARARLLFIKINFKGNFLYFKRVFRLFWQLFSQIGPPPPLAPPSELLRGGGPAPGTPLYPRLIMLQTKSYFRL